MSTLRVSNLLGSAGAGMTSMYLPGSVVQCKVNRVDTQLVYSCAATGSEFTDLRVSITPKFANSMILCQFMLFGEGGSTHDWIMRVWKNAAVPVGAYAGYNSVQGNQVWSGIAMPLVYETDYSTTPQTANMLYHDFPGSTLPITYAPGAGHSSGTALSYYVNRTLNSLGTSGQEAGISMSIAWEIAQ